MDLERLSRHLLMTRARTRRRFPESCLDAIEAAIRDAEGAHGGEIRFAVEAALHVPQLLQGMTARARALELFAALHVWDTEHNNGVLIYVLLADRAVEIVADRHIHNRSGTAAWQRISKSMQDCFARQRYQDGAVVGIRGVADELARHFPVRGSTPNELPDRPTLL